MKLSKTRCWVCVHGLPIEYWHPKQFSQLHVGSRLP